MEEISFGEAKRNDRNAVILDRDASKASIAQHLERLMLAQFDEVVCWRERCGRRCACPSSPRYRAAKALPKESAGLDRKPSANHMKDKSHVPSATLHGGTLVRPPKDGCRRRQSLLSLSPIFFALTGFRSFYVSQRITETL